jgi:hypothetical protein
MLSAILTFFKDWLSLIIKLWANHPVVGSIVTLMAIVWLWFTEKTTNPEGDEEKRRTHVFVAIVGWLIVVPILGFFSDAVQKVVEVTWAVISALWHVITWLYDRFVERTEFVLVVFAIAVLTYIVWELVLKPRRPYWRAAFVTIAFLLVVAIGVPIANQFWPIAKDQPTAQAKPNSAPPASKASAIGK